MIRTTAVPRPLRVGAAAASVAGLALLAGCAGQTTSTADSGTASQNPAASADAGSGSSSGSTSFTDGTYTAEGTYQTPETIEKISVTLTVASDVVTDVEVTGEPQAQESKRYQGEFIGGIKDVAVGKKLADLTVDKVGGSSLTSGGFNAAVKEIRTEAAS